MIEVFLFYIGIPLPVLPVPEILVSQPVSEQLDDPILRVAFYLANVGHVLFTFFGKKLNSVILI
jgi:hypothetical protein